MRATTLSLALLALCACTPRGDQQAATDAQANAAKPAADAAAAVPAPLSPPSPTAPPPAARKDS